MQNLRTRLRRTRMALQTALGLGARGFFTPYRYAAQAAPATGYPEIEALMAAGQGDFARLLDRIDALEPGLAAFGGAPPAPRLDQSWFPTLDAAAAYALLHDAPPRRIVEVGSGHSTRILSRALRDSGAVADHRCIDPAPRATLEGLPVNWERALLSEAHLPLFDALEAGDVAFFDSSHILWPGLDCDLIFNRILARLKPGVRVHIHDILLPDPYPEHWAWRGYTEQNALGGWVLSGAYRIEFSSHYASSRMGAMTRPVLAALPRHSEALDTSLWMVKNAAP